MGRGKRYEQREKRTEPQSNIAGDVNIVDQQFQLTKKHPISIFYMPRNMFIQACVNIICTHVIRCIHMCERINQPQILLPWLGGLAGTKGSAQRFHNPRKAPPPECEKLQQCFHQGAHECHYRTRLLGVFPPSPALQ